MLGASIVGVVGAAVALTALAIGSPVASDADAPVGRLAPAFPRAPSKVEARVPDRTVPAATDPPTAPTDETRPPASLPPVTVPPATSADTAPGIPPAPAIPVVPVAVYAFADPATCPPSGRAAVVDRETQRGWLCGDGRVTAELPITSAWIQPDPGDYGVYAKDMHSSSQFTGRYSTMTHFVAFTHGEVRGARIAFHSVPTYDDGSFVQPLESVGALERRGESAGCIRVLPADAELIWSWLEIGDLVRVVS